MAVRVSSDGCSPPWTTSGIPLGAEGLDIVSLAKERSDQVGMNRRGLDTLAAATADSEALVPGQALAKYEAAKSKSSAKARDQVRVRPERVFVPGAKEAVALAPGSSERYLLERLRDEAHRFAITHHRKRRGKRSLTSALDSIEGVGPAMKKKLLKHFGGVAALRGADLEALQAVSGVGPKLAQRLYDSLGGPGRARETPDAPEA